VRGLDDARNIEGVDDAQVFVTVGGQLMPLTDSAKRAGYVLARGSTRDEAAARAAAALACLHIDTAGPARAEASA
jgi:hypothetical protein